MAILKIFLLFGVLLAANEVFGAARDVVMAPPPVLNKDNSNARPVPVTLRLDCKKGGTCKCVSPDGNIVISGKMANVRLTSCKCFSARQSSTPPPGSRMVGGYIPQCDDNTGAYTPTQSHGGTGFSWCVDPEGNKKGESTRNFRSLKC